MFLLISFVFGNNYCVGNSFIDCKSICQSFTDNFADFYKRIPSNEELNAYNDTIHNIYVSSNVNYYDTIHNLIFCNSSIHLIYENPKTIKIKDHIYADSKKISNDVSMLFTFSNTNTQYLTIEVETEKESKIKPFIIESISYISITTKFYTEYVPENLITLSSKIPYNINILEITDNVEKLFSNPNNLTTKTFSYYCLSDKKNKCEKYKNYNLKFINYTSQIKSYPCLFIVESTKPQVLIIEPKSIPFYYKQYIHIIAMQGSDITCLPKYSFDDGEFYTILHPDSIEMHNMYFEGQGKFTLFVNANISLVATTKTNNNHFTLKTRNPFDKSVSYIYALRNDLSFNFVNKIKVSEYSLFHGPKCLSGLFESGKFLSDDEFIVYNVTEKTLKETDFNYVTYYFKEGDHNIPKTWKRPCRFQGINPNKTNFIFSDVYSYDGRRIDNFIDVNFIPSLNFNMITIKPAKHFYLSSFKNIYRPQYIENYTIVVENDFVMTGTGPISSFDDDEISHDQCKIIGNGTIRFRNTHFMNQVREFCKIDKNVKLEYLNRQMPPVYICLGQSSKENCISEIKGNESLTKYDCIWLRNIKTKSFIFYYDIQIYVTDRQLFLDDSYYNLILTPNSVVTVQYDNNLRVYKNGIKDITPQNSSAKLIVFYTYSNSPDYNEKPIFRVYYEDAPTEINFKVYFHYEIVKLYMIYYQNYTKNAIQLYGKCLIYIREPYMQIMNIFNPSNLIDFIINPYNDYQQICFSNKPIQSSNLYDFVLCSNEKKFNQYDSVSKYNNPKAYIYLNINLDFNSYYRCTYFYICNTKITVSVELPNESLLLFDNSFFDIISKRRYLLYYNDKEIMFSFGVKDHITLDCVNVPSNKPTVRFTSSLNYVEIFPSSTVQNLIQYFNISVPNNFTIYSPAPKYLMGLFGSTPINYSKNWEYYHLSDEGKLFYDSYPSILFDNFEEDIDLPENIVLSVGKNDNITIPLNWTKVHNFYIYQESNDYFLINKPLNLTYNLNGLVLNHRFNITVGHLKINVPEIFTVNSYIPSSNIRHYFYNSYLNCSENPKTNLFTGSMYTNGIKGDGQSLVSINGYGYPNDLTIISKNGNEQDALKRIMKLYSNQNVKFRFDFNSICYCTDNCNSKCPGKSFIVSDITSLLAVKLDYPELTILVFNDLDIPYPTGDHFILNPKDENVLITVPDFPNSMITTENETLQFNYSDSTLIEIINKSYVDVTLKEYLSIFIESNTNSSITFWLDSDVFISLESKIEANFSISVEKCLNHFYIENDNVFDNIFNGLLESYMNVCAYDLDAESLCSYSRHKKIDNVFIDPFIFNAVEIALSSETCKIKLPSILKQIKVNILPSSSSSLILQTASNVQITPDNVIINDKWIFEGDRKILTIKLGYKSTLSVIEEMSLPIVLQLTDKKSFIYLRDFDEQNSSLITITKYGNDTNEIIVYGNKINYDNFVNSIKSSENIKITRNGTQRYLCICNYKKICDTCKEGVDGEVILTNAVLSDPGEDVKIRVFMNYDVSSKLFTNDHDVFINSNYSLNLKYVSTVNQNIEEGLKVDNLHFVNGSNLLLKPRDIDLNIIMREKEKGPYFTIEMDTFLRLNVTNFDNKNIKSSRIHVNGFGELNIYDYPFDRIRPARTVKVIKGVYIICNTRADKDVCSYKSAHRYKRLGHHDLFRPDFDPNSKILVFMDSYTTNIKVNTRILQNQKIQFIRAPSNSRRLLQGQNRLIFESNSEILNTENSTELFSEEGGTSLDNADSDLFIVCFNETIKIRQEGNISASSKPITIQPMNNHATIIIDDSVDIEKQKLKIESENDQPVSITLLTNKNVTSKEIDKFIDLNKEKISISLGGPIPKSKSKNGPKIGVFIGIIMGSVVIVAVIVVVIVLIIVKNKKKEKNALSEDDIDFSSDSTF